MASEIKCFPAAQPIGIVDQLKLGYVERLDQASEGIPFLQQQFEIVAISKLDLGVSESDVRAELISFLHAIVTHAYNLFDLQLDALEVDVPTLGVCFAYNRQTLNAG